ncbi:MAG: nitrilase-related carbon-nitrogen hydrolase [Chloroflexota bacterium]|nr:nitrilase-related carbon-nitrogen hydrolase [Chloroflexota bacterium]
MKIVLAQIDCMIGDVDYNCAQLTSFNKQAKQHDCELIIFPEMIDTGYDMPTIRQTASSWTGTPFLTAQNAAMESKMWLICGISEREGDIIYNSLAVFDNTGKLAGKYRKTHLFTADPINEDQHLRAGNSYEIIDIASMKLGLMICYDIRFPEMSRHLVRKGSTVLVVCSAWPFPRQHHWRILTLARAIENQCYVVATNRVGTDGSTTFCGSSCVIDPKGDILTLGTENSSELLITDIDQEQVYLTRQSHPTLNDRRDDLYRLWDTS